MNVKVRLLSVYVLGLKDTGRLLQAIENPVTLSREQNAVLEAVRSGRNVFFTGSAGTGKSFLLKRIIGNESKQGFIIV